MAKSAGFESKINKDVLKEIDSIEETQDYTILKLVECSALILICFA
jgi:hypothetical protein